jgi:hypothetical protein
MQETTSDLLPVGSINAKKPQENSRHPFGFQTMIELKRRSNPRYNLADFLYNFQSMFMLSGFTQT